MTKQEKIDQFDPSGVGLKNDKFIGLPFDEEDAEVVLLPVPWDVTVSYATGTNSGPENILGASVQLDLMDLQIPDAWKMGIFMRPIHNRLVQINKINRTRAVEIIHLLESGLEADRQNLFATKLRLVNQACREMVDWVEQQCLSILDQGKLVGLIGGDHSTPLGYLRALSKKHDSFGILQIDAHMDLRKAYEGFEYSHASIFYNVLQLQQVQKLVQVGIRDYCEEEIDYIANEKERIKVFFDYEIKEQLFEGIPFKNICKQIISQLPEKVYISFDIDGLQPNLCPNTGTPVPGGMGFEQAIYLLHLLVESGKTIIGFDLCEVAGHPYEWDGNVGARLVYKLANLTGKSNQRI